MIKKFEDLAEMARSLPKKSCIALACAHDEHSIEALIVARKDGIADCVLVGNEAEIRRLLEKHGQNPDDYDITDCDDKAESIRICADYIKAGKADILMKGKMETADIMRGVLNRDNGLRTENALSLGAIYEVPAYHKIVGFSDVAITPYPDLAAKKSIIQNIVSMFNALGHEEPKVAVLAAIEKVNPKMPETVEADQLKQMNISGEIKNCIVEGPISFDLAVDPEAAGLKGYISPVAGDADILIAPDSKEYGRKYEESNYIVCHIGGGVSVSAHKKGRMVDGNDIAKGLGPIAPTRCGNIPAGYLIDFIFQSGKSQKELNAYCIKNGGVADLLQTSDMKKVYERVENKDPEATLVWNAMIYSICKEIGAMFCVLSGDVDGILLSGGLVFNHNLVEQIKARCGKLAEIYAYPGEFEMEALANGALRVLRGEEKAKEYK